LKKCFNDAEEIAKIVDKESQKELFKQALELAEKIEDSRVKSKALVSIAVEIAKIGEKELAIKTFKQALELAEKIKDSGNYSHFPGGGKNCPRITRKKVVRDLNLWIQSLCLCVDIL
jgi:tetratricopeptide (TPR) repeat protein